MAELSFTEKIKRFALNEAGFDLVGISKPVLSKNHHEAYSHWIANGFAGSMKYMTRSQNTRAFPDTVLPGVRSVISLAINYYHPEDNRPKDSNFGKVAKYAYGADYHKSIEKKLKMLSRFIENLSVGQNKVKSYVDTGPVLEKAFAQNAGLGFFGKNTNLITKKFGSWVFLASILTDLELEADEPHGGSCGSCRICIDACPTGALLGNYTLDARRCISYLTIESRDAHPEDLKKAVGEWVFGCDICQDVCPYNHKATTTRHEDLYPRKIAGTWLSLEEINNLKTEEEFAVRFQGSPLKRAKRSGLLRNAQTVKTND